MTLYYTEIVQYPWKCHLKRPCNLSHKGNLSEDPKSEITLGTFQAPNCKNKGKYLFRHQKTSLSNPRLTWEMKAKIKQ